MNLNQETTINKLNKILADIRSFKVDNINDLLATRIQERLDTALIRYCNSMTAALDKLYTYDEVKICKRLNRGNNERHN